ncbi:PREDICTED: RING finger protein 215-like [Camelina sativa]|uniref:RING finger protein 215-like n=1 Tax=Camelina sativa TaxID=90675 RepID=A0ABM0ZBD2_CAMSA|nr:PREDICTED: RING finger protein 215-like [Camelina sativa]XP_010513211.1 PREDICTED: RING finger protein 215-like [Camelina sativa]
MDTESFRLDIHLAATSQDPSLGLLSTVKITVKRGYFEVFIIEKNDDHRSIKSVGSYRDSPPGPDSKLILKLRTFEPKDVYRTLHSQLHDNLLSEYIADEIVVQALRQRSKSSNLPLTQQPLFMKGTVKLTQKVYNVVRRNSALSLSLSATNLTTCAICLEDLDLSRTEDYCHVPNCSHCYHEECLNKWVDRSNGTCPLCRELFDEESN